MVKALGLEQATTAGEDQVRPSHELGLPVTQPCGNVTVLRSQPGLSAAHSRLLVGPGIQAVFGGVGAIFCRNSAVVNGLGAVVRGSGAPRGGLRAFVSRILAIARRSISASSTASSRTRAGASCACS